MSMHPARLTMRTTSLCLVLCFLLATEVVADHPAPLPVPDSVAGTEAEMKPYGE